MKNKKGFTLIEVSLAVIIVSLIFTVAYKVISESRKQSQKGLWIVGTASELLTVSKQMSLLLRQKNYPTVVERGNVQEKYEVVFDENTGLSTISGSGQNIESAQLYNYKEYVEYYKSGRMNIDSYKINHAVDDFEVNIVRREIRPADSQQVFMYFPIFTPEIVGGEDGVIHWIIFSLGKKDKITGLSELYMGTYTDKYHSVTDGSSDILLRAFNIGTKGPHYKINLNSSRIKNKKLLSDVCSVEVRNDESRFLKINNKKYKGNNEKERERNIFTVTIKCCNPKDKKIVLDEVFSVTCDTDCKVKNM